MVVECFLPVALIIAYTLTKRLVNRIVIEANLNELCPPVYKLTEKSFNPVNNEMIGALATLVAVISHDFP